MPKYIDEILSYERLAKRLESKPNDKKRTIEIIKEIRSNFSPRVTSALAKILKITFAKLYHNISFVTPKDLNLIEFSKTHNVILIPNHQSHADYVALTYLLWTKYRLPVYVAGGINLNIFPIGPMFRRAGCFFIRRSFVSDILYKLTFEAYISYLLKNNQIIEFFLEGGRSRTGKLLTPRFGLFQMILETYSNLKDAKPLAFLPVSIVHEFIPEQRAHAKELVGENKQKEKSSQLLKIFGLANKKLGSIHITVNDPIIYNLPENKRTRDMAHDVAFDCLRSIGNGMPVIPTSLLSLVLLDEPSGAMTWDNILRKSKTVIEYCRQFKIPLSPSLSKDKWEASIDRSLRFLIANKKVLVIENEKLFRTFYAIKEDSRIDLLYFKSTILHHFIVPAIVDASWMKIFNGHLKNRTDLKNFILQFRKQLKYEFFLPTLREFNTVGFDVVSFGANRKIDNLDECFKLTTNEYYNIGVKVGVFSRAFAYLFEGYYIASLTLKHFGKSEFNKDKFRQIAKEIYEIEKLHGRFIKYPESYTVPIMNNSLKYFEHKNVITRIAGTFKVVSDEQVDLMIEKYAVVLTDLLTFNYAVDSPYKTERKKHERRNHQELH